MSAGKTISIRVPEHVPDELRAATSLPFSTVVRHVIMALLEYYRAERKTQEGRAVQDQAKLTIAEVTRATLQGAENND